MNAPAIVRLVPYLGLVVAFIRRVDDLDFLDLCNVELDGCGPERAVRGGPGREAGASPARVRRVARDCAVRAGIERPQDTGSPNGTNATG